MSISSAWRAWARAWSRRLWDRKITIQPARMEVPTVRGSVTSWFLRVVKQQKRTQRTRPAAATMPMARLVRFSAAWARGSSSDSYSALSSIPVVIA